MKKSICALFLCLCCVFCCSCGQARNVSAQVFETNAFRLVRQVDNNEKISLSYVFPLNSFELKGLGFAEKQINAFKFYLTTYVNALAQNNRQKQTEGVSVGGCEYYDQFDGLGFKIVFENIDAQKKFFGIDETNSESGESENKTSSGLFIKTTKLKTNFPFSTKSAGDMKMVVLMAISSWASDQSLTQMQKKEVQNILNDSKFVYDFGSKQTSLKSEVMYDDQNFHHNVFIKTFEQLEKENKITFYTTMPNYPVWYLSALLVVILGMIFAFFYIKVKKKSNIIKK